MFRLRSTLQALPAVAAALWAPASWAATPAETVADGAEQAVVEHGGWRLSADRAEDSASGGTLAGHLRAQRGQLVVTAARAELGDSSRITFRGDVRVVGPAVYATGRHAAVDAAIVRIDEGARYVGDGFTLPAASIRLNTDDGNTILTGVGR